MRPRTRLDLAEEVPRSILPSSDQAFWKPFWHHFGSLWILNRHQKMRPLSDVILGSNVGKKLIDFDTKFEPSEDDTFL